MSKKVRNLISKILAEKSDIREVEAMLQPFDSYTIIKSLDQIINCSSDLELSQLPELEQMIVLIFAFELCKDFNLFFSEEIEYAEKLKEYFQKIEAFKAEEALNKISSYFEDNMIPSDEDEYEEMLARIKKSNPDFDYFGKIQIEYDMSKEDVISLLNKHIIPRIHELQYINNKLKMTEEIQTIKTQEQESKQLLIASELLNIGKKIGNKSVLLEGIKMLLKLDMTDRSINIYQTEYECNYEEAKIAINKLKKSM